MKGILSLILLFSIAAVHAVGIDTPRLRPSPYFGSISGMHYANVKELGKHSYDSFFGEKNPLIYTAKAGYIDIGHLRESADRARYLSEICHENIVKGKTTFSYSVIEPAVYTVTLEYPDNWGQLSKKEQCQISREISIDLGQYFAQQSTIWHEIVTWYGYSSVGLLSEEPSSFSWEDTYSDLLGTKLAVMAMRENAEHYDEAMTEIIARELAKLKPKSARTAEKATDLIRGQWYWGRYPFVTMKKRNFDVGFDDQAITPFRVPGVFSEVPEALCTLPSLDSLERYAFKMNLELTPKENQKSQILSIVYPKKDGTTLQPAIDYPKIISHIRQEAIRKSGADVDKPTLKTSNHQKIAVSKAH